MKKFFIIVMTLIIGTSIFAYDDIYQDVEKALKLSQIENKITLMVFSSKSCIYCDKLREETFNDEKVMEILDAGFNVVEIFPEDRETSFIINDQEIKANYNQLSSIFGVRGTPSMFFVNSDNQVLTSLPGFAPAESFIPILQFLGSEAYLTTDFQTFSEKSSDYIGNRLIEKVDQNEADFVLSNDKNAVYIEEASELENIFSTVVVESETLADELNESGVYRVLLKSE